MPIGSQIAAEVMNDVADRLTPELRNHAVTSGWPKHSAAKLHVVVEDGSLSYWYSGPKSEMESLEFGTSSTAPLPALNNFFGNYAWDREFRNRISEGMSRRVTEMIVKAFS